MAVPRMGLGGPRAAALPTCLPAARVRAAAGSAPPGHGPCPPGGGRREEAGRRGNNVVGCFADCQPRSRILLSTPLGLTATGSARRGKSPLIWSWKERGKVILRCLRRWVIGPPQSAAPGVGPRPAGRWRRRAAPRRDARSGKQARRFRGLARGLLLCERWDGGGGDGEVGAGGRVRKRTGSLFYDATVKLSPSEHRPQLEGVTLPCLFHVNHSRGHERMQAPVLGPAGELGCKFREEH